MLLFGGMEDSEILAGPPTLGSCQAGSAPCRKKSHPITTVVIFAAKVAKEAAGQAPEPVKEAPLKKRC